MHIDLIDQSPAPAGLIAYGTDPALHLIGNVTIGRDIHFTELLTWYDAVIDTRDEVSDWDALEKALSLATADDPDREPAPGITEVLTLQNTPFTTWSGGVQDETTPARGSEGWYDVVTQARAVPVCDQ